MEYNKSKLLLDFELPSGNIFNGPLNLLHIPRCGTAPQQGLILSSNKVVLSGPQKVELKTKFTAAGYSSDRADALVASFDDPAMLRVGTVAGAKAISITRNKAEFPICSANIPVNDDDWVVYEALELAKIFDLNAIVSNDYVSSLVDHPLITGRGWELVSPSIVGGLPSDGVLTQVHSNMYGSSSSYGFPSQYIQEGPKAWFLANSSSHVYASIPVGKYPDAYGTKYVSVLVRRVRTIHDRNISLVAMAPREPARLTYRAGILGVGLNRVLVGNALTAKGIDGGSFWGDGHGDAMETFDSGSWPAPVYSDVVTDLETDWPGMLKPVAKDVGAGGNVIVSRALYVYGWLDAPRSCCWTYDDMVTTQSGDVSIINVNATSALYNFEDGQLRRFLTQLVDGGQYTGADLAKLVEARDSIPNTWTSAIHVLSRPQGFMLSTNIEDTLPLAVYADDNGMNPRDIELASSPTVKLGQVADKARAKVKLPSLCFMPKGDQVTGIFGNEVITFTSPSPGLYEFTMTQFGNSYAATVDEMMVATALGATWVVTGTTEAAVAGHYFNGATSKAEARTWVSAGEIATYHDPLYRIDDYACWHRWNGWPTTTGAQLAKLSVNQLLGDRVNTANTLYAMSVWSVGRRIRNTYVDFDALLLGEADRIVPSVTLKPRKGWYTDVVGTIVYSENDEVARALTSVNGTKRTAEAKNSSKQAVFSFELLENVNNSDKYGVSLSTNPGVGLYTIKMWSGAADATAFNEGTMSAVAVGDVITFALDQNTTLSKLRVYLNGVFKCAWHVPYATEYYPLWQFDQAGCKVRLDTRPAFKPLAGVDWDQ